LGFWRGFGEGAYPLRSVPDTCTLAQDLVEDASAKAKRPVTSEAGKDMFEAIRRAIAG